MDDRDPESAAVDELEERRAPRKLDLGYFTVPDRCPQMVRRGARNSFAVFLHLAHRFLQARGEPVLAEHEAICDACGLDPRGPHAGSAVSRLLRSLRLTYRVIDYQPVQRRQPRIRLAPATPGADVLNPRHYVYFPDGWDGRRRAIFDALEGGAFSAEYMVWIAQYEAALARVKHGRAYWFFPQERMATAYHISSQFAGKGLRGLVELGILHVVYGQRGAPAPNDEFGAANRYYFEGIEEVLRRHQQMAEVQREFGKEFESALVLSKELNNGATVKNVEGLCELIAEYGEDRVRAAIGKVSSTSRRNLRRRLEYIRTTLKGR